jgi:hypothetical protein
MFFERSLSMDNEEKPQELQEQWQETSTEEPQQAVCQAPQETPAEEFDETSEEIEQE